MSEISKDSDSSHEYTEAGDCSTRNHPWLHVFGRLESGGLVSPKKIGETSFESIICFRSAMIHRRVWAKGSFAEMLLMLVSPENNMVNNHLVHAVVVIELNDELRMGIVEIQYLNNG